MIPPRFCLKLLLYFFSVCPPVRCPARVHAHRKVLCNLLLLLQRPLVSFSEPWVQRPSLKTFGCLSSCAATESTTGGSGCETVVWREPEALVRMILRPTGTGFKLRLYTLAPAWDEFRFPIPGHTLADADHNPDPQIDLPDSAQTCFVTMGLPGYCWAVSDPKI